MNDTDKYEGRLADALICVREGGVDDDYSKIRIEDALDDMKDLILEVKRLREALITVQQSLVWDEKDRAMDGDSVTLEAFVAQVEQVRSDITEMIE